MAYKGPTLYPFQIDAIADVFLSGEGRLLLLDTGCGKSLISIALSALMQEQGDIDKILVVCEKNKLGEWSEDYAQHTDLDVKRYHGASRKKVMDDLPDVLVTTYETAKTDLVTLTKGKRSSRRESGDLLDAMIPYSWLIIYDEMAKLGNRSSEVYRSHEYALRRLRKNQNTKVVGLTATPIERDWENAFNQLRLVAPSMMPTVGDFERNFVTFRDEFGRNHYNHIRIHEFVEMAKRAITRKSKHDPDVLENFPVMVEEVMKIELDAEHRMIYDQAEDLLRDEEGMILPGGYPYLRQLASWPASLLGSEESSESSQMLCEALGADILARTQGGKIEALLDHLRKIRAQGEKSVVFTFFGQSILPLIREALEDEEFEVHVYHGGQTAKEAERSLKAFKSSPSACVFLTSDSGARGINLPEASHIVEFESALTYAKRVQRLNRISRLSSTTEQVHCLTLVAADTVEESIIANMLRRNQMTDDLNDDDHRGMGVEERRKLFK